MLRRNQKPRRHAPAAPATEADQQKQTAAAARQAYEGGIKSYTSGKYQPAVDELSGALRGGGLASSEMAKALYVRGLAYKKLSKPGVAISDLTSALWLKNGLGEADQKNAMSERSEAYRMAGLGDGTSGSDNVSVANPNPRQQAQRRRLRLKRPWHLPLQKPPLPSRRLPAKHLPRRLNCRCPHRQLKSRASLQTAKSARDAANARRLAAAPVETNGFQSAAAGSLICE